MKLTRNSLLVRMVFVIVLAGTAQAKYMDAPALIRKGNGSFSNGQYEDASRAYKQAFKTQASSDAAYNLAVTYHHRLKYYNKAMHYYQRFLELEPNAPETDQVKTWLAKVRHEVFPEEALKNPALRRLSAQNLMMQVGTNDPEIFQGNEYLKQKNYKKAIKAYEQAIVQKNSIVACFNLALLYDFELRFLHRAIFYYQKFLVLAPNNSRTSQVSKWLADAKAAFEGQRGHFYQGTALQLRQP